MKLIKPSEISARILTLLEESEERVIIVSPYMKISKWYRLLNKINELKRRSINPEIYVRDDPDNNVTFQDLDQLELFYKKIPYLHCKLYMNEKYGIVTSMNLLLSSEINGLEIGYLIDAWEEYNELLVFFHRYIHQGETVFCKTIAGRAVADPEDIMQKIQKELHGSAKISWYWIEHNALHINTGLNNYTVFIKDGWLRIKLFIASAKRFESSSESEEIIKKVSDLSAIEVSLNKASGKGENFHLSGRAYYKFSSASVTEILHNETCYLVESVKRFIIATTDM